ncbi:MAG: prepilin-type N-terminal cleavage/methylation domain-containing protein [Bilifractor sp.]|nr:prepilin-type N-terminal cleavage/methylation domain-containing protein [Lachnospiraceae bacterium]MDY2836648.1 prepilin-type N-terminal cleavage/methylation domain-containing protein [Bilifractor sp.]
MSRKQNKGFTLAELLIVVAIIAVLVAISIPIFSTQLKKARFAVNQANARSAMSAAITCFLETPDDVKKTTSADRNQHMYFRYDTKTGQCIYVGWGTASPNDRKDFQYKNFANIGYSQGGGKGETDISKWKMNTGGKLYSNGTMSDTVLTDRTYQYWDVAMQGDGTFLAIVCLW